jgi:hypothetical protein
MRRMSRKRISRRCWRADKEPKLSYSGTLLVENCKGWLWMPKCSGPIG